MRVQDALGLAQLRDELENELGSLHANAVGTEQYDPTAESSRNRFRAIGRTIIEAPDTVSTPIEGAPGSIEHVSQIDVGVGGLTIALKAREVYTQGSLRGRELDTVEAVWSKDTYPADAPLATQRVSDADAIHGHPATLGMLRLIEQSLTVAELARHDTADV